MGDRSADRLAVLMRVGRELTVGLDVTVVLRRSLALSMQAVGAAAGNLLLVDEKGRPAMLLFLYEGMFHWADVDLARRLFHEGLEGWVVQNRQPVLLDDVAGEERWLQDIELRPTFETGAAICVPLLLPRRAVGALTCVHPQPGSFGEDDLQAVQFVADQAAVALENARLFAAEEQRRELADTLSEITRVITATLDLDEVLNLILEQLGRVISYDSASVFLVRDRQLVIRASRGLEGLDAARRISFDMDGGNLLARVVADRKLLVRADVQQDPDWQAIPGLVPVHGWIGAPLTVRGEVIGALTVNSYEPEAYGELDARLVAAFADHAAVAVGNARLWRQIQRQLDEVAFLHKTGQAVTASLELDHVLRSLMESVRDHFQVEAASVALVDEGTGELVFRVATGAAAEQVVGMRLDPGQGVAGWVAGTGQPAMVPAADDDVRFYEGVDKATGFQTQALMAVPINLGQRTIGVIEAINPRQGHMEENDLELLASVATLAASAIQNARHFTRARDAEQRYASLFENSADPIIITDASGSITDVNRRLCEMLGYEKEELIGRDIAALQQDPEATRQRLTQAVEGESVFYNVESLSGGGSPVPFEVRATRIFHDARPYIQWIYHDLTERFQLERVRQDLTQMIIHDLRNPLSSVMNSLELIHAAVTDKTITMPVEELFAIAQRSGERLYLLIDSILDLARLEEGQAELARKPLDVEGLVEEVVGQMQPTAAAVGLSLEGHTPAGLPPLVGDRDLLQRVLLNLLGNALKFTPAGGEVRLEVSRPDPETLLFAVSDTGPGIQPEYHEHIFDRFARVYREGTRGTGLGLALCRLAVEAHGGRIWVESEPGHGATFKFTLPVGGNEAA